MNRTGVGSVLVAILCITSLGLAGGTLATPGGGPAEALGGETDPSVLENSRQVTESNGSQSQGDRNATGSRNSTNGASNGTGDGAGSNGTATPSGGQSGPGGTNASQNGTGGGQFNGTNPSGNGTESTDTNRSDGQTAPTPTPGSQDADSRSTDGTPTPTPEDGTNSSGQSGGQESDGGSQSSSEEGSGEGGQNGQSGSSNTSGGSYSQSTQVGGQISLSESKELLIEAPKQTRWRLGAYATYTGSGWDRDAGERREVTGPLSTAGDDEPRPKYEINVTTLKPFDSLATAWRPAFADADRSVYVDDNKGLTVEEAFEANDTYTTVTYGPPSRSAARRSTRTEYPAEIEQRYLQLPDNTPAKLERRTNEITSDAETPYETAAAIESWLESNKEYSLNASHDPEGDIATQFVFEMDAGYCQYFATTMTAMLRTQDIPARYVTGYGYGEQLEDGRYLLRGKNAHAWVEVYFEDVGWVAFDPTPSSGRSDAGRDSQQQADDTSSSAEDSDESQSDEEDSNESQSDEEDSDENQDEEEDSQQESKNTDDDTSESHESGPLNVTIDPDPVPGREVTVTVRQDGERVSGAEVFFNDDSIGTTNASGQTRGTVPYSDELNVTVRRPTPARASISQPREAYSVPRGSQWSGASTLAVRPRTAAVQTATEAEVSVTIPLNTNISVALPTDPVPGTQATIEATIDGVPVTDAVVSFGDQQTRTDDKGTATVTVPFQRETEVFVQKDAAIGNESLLVLYSLQVEPPAEPKAGTDTAIRVTVGDRPVPNATVTVGNATTVTTGQEGEASARLPFQNETTITVSRGEFSETRSLSLDTELDVAVTGRIAPGFKPTIEVTNGGKPVEGVAITFAGTEYAQTDAEGRASIRPFPLAMDGTIVAERGAVRGTAGPYPLWPYWLAYLLVPALLGVVALGRSSVTSNIEIARLPRAILAQGRRLADRLVAIARWVPIAFVSATVRLVTACRRCAARVRNGIIALANDLVGTLQRFAHRLQASARRLAREIQKFIRLLVDPAAWQAAGRWLLALSGRLLRRLRSSQHAEATTAPTAVTTSADGLLAEDLEDADPERIEQILEAWRELEQSVGRRPQWTPTEVATRARRRGYPGEAVEEITSIFQQIRYGESVPTAGMVEAATTAADALQRGETADE